MDSNMEEELEQERTRPITWPVPIHAGTDDPNRHADWIEAKRLSPHDRQRLWQHLNRVAPTLVAVLQQIDTRFGVQELYFDIRGSDRDLHADLLAACSRPD